MHLQILPGVFSSSQVFQSDMELLVVVVFEEEQQTGAVA
jgi:hypothetical protein